MALIEKFQKSCFFQVVPAVSASQTMGVGRNGVGLCWEATLQGIVWPGGYGSCLQGALRRPHLLALQLICLLPMFPAHALKNPGALGFISLLRFSPIPQTPA